jgi:Leucine-rich repeat (LRR) protein
VASLEPLGKLPKLRSLYLFKMPVPLALAPLATAQALDFLDMDGDTVDDLTPLGSVTTLRQLSLRNGVIAKPSSVSTLSNVQDLDLTAVLTDATPLAGLNNVQKLRIGHKPLTHFSAIVGLVKLQFLDASSAGITDVSALGTLTQLRGVNLASNQISDITPLGDLLELSNVVLVGNQITDLGPLAANAGIGAGDSVLLEQNPLVCATVAADVQTLRGRGATVSSDCL